ncbi:hypothetical protein [Aquimarina rubra]|uniref:Auto-transporter adhesin head GIN domain-containing protein n=1 Tax=Aquimarina rubra TaxID=1920033 RepID=A0ABW5LFT1_9FLAO
MNKAIYLGLIIILFSCKSNTGIAQEKEENNPDKTPIEKPKFGDSNDNDRTKLKFIDNNQIPPNTVHLNAVLLEVSEDKVICNVSGSTTVKVKVKQVVGSGSGIVNMVSANQEVVLTLRKASKNRTSLKAKLEKEFFIIAKEKPCTDLSKTIYEIISFESKN